eukprot:1979754-Rhodomonas_salina.1
MCRKVSTLLKLGYPGTRGASPKWSEGPGSLQVRSLARVTRTPDDRECAGQAREINLIVVPASGSA